MPETDADEPDQTRVNLLVNDETLADWDEHIGKNAEYQHRSQLIRVAVRKEIARIENDSGQGQSTGTQTSGEVTSVLQSLANQIESVDENVDRLRDDVNTSVPVDMDAVLLQVLPEPDELPEEREGYTVGEIARRIGGDPDKISTYLAELYRSHPGVHTVEETRQDPNEGRVQVTVYYRESTDDQEVYR